MSQNSLQKQLSDADQEHECRVCRGGAEEKRPLHSPCLCSGSIMFCHQDCLEEWLQHSKKDSCELCNTKYTFVPLYDENSPSIIPIHRLILSIIKKAFFQILPFIIRVFVAFFLWLIVVPISTSWLYRFWIHGNRVINIYEPIQWEAMWSDLISGIVLAGVIALSFIVLLSFADFLRFHWNLDQQMDGPDDIAAGGRIGRQAVRRPGRRRQRAFLPQVRQNNLNPRQDILQQQQQQVNPDDRQEGNDDEDDDFFDGDDERALGAANLMEDDPLMLRHPHWPGNNEAPRRIPLPAAAAAAAIRRRQRIRGPLARPLRGVDDPHPGIINDGEEEGEEGEAPLIPEQQQQQQQQQRPVGGGHGDNHRGLGQRFGNIDRDGRVVDGDRNIPFQEQLLQQLQREDQQQQREDLVALGYADMEFTRAINHALLFPSIRSIGHRLLINTVVYFLFLPSLGVLFLKIAYINFELSKEQQRVLNGTAMMMLVVPFTLALFNRAKYPQDEVRMALDQGPYRIVAQILNSRKVEKELGLIIQMSMYMSSYVLIRQYDISNPWSFKGLYLIFYNPLYGALLTLFLTIIICLFRTILERIQVMIWPKKTQIAAPTYTPPGTEHLPNANQLHELEEMIQALQMEIAPHGRNALADDITHHDLNPQEPPGKGVVERENRRSTHDSHNDESKSDRLRNEDFLLENMNGDVDRDIDENCHVTIEEKNDNYRSNNDERGNNDEGDEPNRNLKDVIVDDDEDAWSHLCSGAFEESPEKMGYNNYYNDYGMDESKLTASSEDVNSSLYSTIKDEGIGIFEDTDLSTDLIDHKDFLHKFWNKKSNLANEDAHIDNQELSNHVVFDKNKESPEKDFVRVCEHLQGVNYEQKEGISEESDNALPLDTFKETEDNQKQNYFLHKFNTDNDLGVNINESIEGNDSDREGEKREADGNHDDHFDWINLPNQPVAEPEPQADAEPLNANNEPEVEVRAGPEPARAGAGENVRMERDEEVEEMDDVQAADVEIHVAVDELLGFRGPPHVLWRNIMWLLAFNGTYIGLFAFIPFSIGTSVLSSLQKFEPLYTEYIQDKLIAILPYTFRNFLSLFYESNKKSTSNLQLQDMAQIALGYTAMSVVIFIFGGIVRSVRTPFMFIAIVRKLLNALVAIVKVGVLLFLRIFFLPLFLGSLLLGCANNLVQYPITDWVNFAVTNVIGLLAFDWVLGISYMLIVTLSVLQLREVLHPDILAKVIRPQEAHLDLLSSLLHESGITHARRIAASMFVYILIIIFCLWIPSTIIRIALGKPFIIHTWNVITELRIPLELFFLHFSFLTILDRYKDLIGKLQYYWLRFICERLKLSRFLLPFAKLSNEVNAANVAATADEASVRREQGNNSPNVNYNFEKGSFGNEIVRPEDIRVHPVPIQRPPEGWSLQASTNTKRWAWGGEPMSEVEKSVAPRVLMDDWLPRISLLLLLSWILTVIVIIIVAMAPLSLGRLLHFLLRIPPSYLHDPANFSLGVACILQLHSIYLRNRRRIHKILRFRLWKHMPRIPTSIYQSIMKSVLISGVLWPYFLGLLVHIAHPSSTFGGVSSFFDPWWNILINIALGWLVRNVLEVLSRGRLLQLLRLAPRNENIGQIQGNNHSFQVLTIFARILINIEDREWDVITSKISRLDSENWNEEVKALIIGGLKSSMTGCGCAALVHFTKKILNAHDGVVENDTLKGDGYMSLNIALGVGAKLGLWLFLIHALILVLFQPIYGLSIQIYNTIRDENYLIGRKLKNIREDSPVT